MNIRRAKITAVSHYLPERRVTNKDLEKIVDTSDEWIVERTGIHERYVVALCRRARKAMRKDRVELPSWIPTIGARQCPCCAACCSHAPVARSLPASKEKR